MSTLTFQGLLLDSLHRGSEIRIGGISSLYKSNQTCLAKFCSRNLVNSACLRHTHKSGAVCKPKNESLGWYSLSLITM